MAIFVFTAAVGVWAAYSKESASMKFWLIIGAAFIFYALAGQPRENLWYIVVLINLAGVLLAGFFLLTHDWETAPSEFGFLNHLGLRWMSIRPVHAIPKLNPNLVGGLLTLTMPFLLALNLHARRRRYRVGFWLSIVATGFVALGLLLTGSQSAWLALMAGIGAWVIWWLSGKLSTAVNLSRGAAFAILLALACILPILLGLFWPGESIDLLDRLPGRFDASDRLSLNRSSLDLVADYPFTGGGLASFPGLYSQYILVIPVFFLQNGHNTVLDTALEQAILGFVALTGIFIGSIWFLLRAELGAQKENGNGDPIVDLSLVRWAIAVSLVVMMVHGLVDDAVYGSPAVLFLFSLPGLTMAVVLPERELRSGSSRIIGQAQTAILTVILATIVLLALVGKQLTSAWYANLGAVAMARNELAAWPTNQWDDGSNVDALGPAEELFRKSLESYPNNRTAHHRLGLASMLKRDFGSAVAHLEAAARTTPHHEGIRKALAYSYVWSGQFDQAQSLMVEIPEAGQEMQVYSWWWTTQDREDLAARATHMVVELEGAGNLK
jgi:hypothetical protein